MSLPAEDQPQGYHYKDLGPRTRRDGRPNRKAEARPHCDLCGPFCGRYVRVVDEDEYGKIYRCRGCDNE